MNFDEIIKEKPHLQSPLELYMKIQRVKPKQCKKEREKDET